MIDVIFDYISKECERNRLLEVLLNQVKRKIGKILIYLI